MFGGGAESYQGRIPATMTQIWPPAGARPNSEIELVLLFIVNTDTVPHTFRLCRDIDGTEFDEDTAIWWDHPLAAGETFEFQAQTGGVGIPLGRNGAVAVQADVADVLNLTLITVSAKVAET